MPDLGRLDIAISQINLRPLLFLVYPYLDTHLTEVEIRSYHMKWHHDRSIPVKFLIFSKNTTSGELFSMVGDNQIM